MRVVPLQSAASRRVGAALRGATLAMVTAFADGDKHYQMSLTGEIPPETAQAVLASIGRVVPRRSRDELRYRDWYAALLGLGK